MTGARWSGLGRLFAIVLAAGTPAVAIAGWFGPSNYDECVLDGMKGVTSDVAAREIKQACRRKFPSESTLTKEQESEWKKKVNEDKVRELAPQELANIKFGKAGVYVIDSDLGWLTKEMYNGNQKLSICSVTYRYRLHPGEEWSNIYRKKFGGNDGGPLKPFGTVSLNLEGTTDLKEIRKRLTKKGAGIQFDAIEIKGTTSTFPELSTFGCN